MNILLTGGSGFIGLNLLDRFDSDVFNLAVISRSESELKQGYLSIIGDLNSLEKIESRILDFSPDVVIHLAWEGIPDLSETNCLTNLRMSLRFFDYILKNTKCKKILVSGSCFEYERTRGACRESDLVAETKSYFAWAKRTLNQYLTIKCIEKDVTLNWFRIFYVYGPNQRNSSLIPQLIDSFIKKEQPNIRSPWNKNDFIYVSDITEAFVKAITNDFPSGCYNLGSGTSVSILEVTRIVEKEILGTVSISNNMLEQVSNQKTINFWADIEKSSKVMEFSNRIGLHDGIRNHINSVVQEKSLK